MAIFTTNQARQLYVANHALVRGTSASYTKPTRGKIVIFDGETIPAPFYLLSANAKGEVSRSDLIEQGKVVSLSVTSAAKMIKPIRSYTIQVDSDLLDGGNVPAGVNFILRVTFSPFVGLSPEQKLVKAAHVYTKTAMSPKNFYLALAASLKRSVKNENKVHPIITVTTADDKITLSEVPQYWSLGKFSKEVLPFTVSGNVVNIGGVETPWLNLDTDGLVPFTTSTNYTDPNTGATVNNGHTIADMEYFYHGERGDQYRKVGWPNNFDTEYLVDPASAYDVMDIQYFYSGGAEDIERSPKTLTIVSKVTNDLKSKANDIALYLGLSKYFLDGEAKAATAATP